MATYYLNAVKVKQKISTVFPLGPQGSVPAAQHDTSFDSVPDFDPDADFLLSLAFLAVVSIF